MKTVVFLRPAQRDLLRHGNMAARIRKALGDYAADPRAHANNITPLVGEPYKRLRVGDYRAIFVETDTEIIVAKVAPRGGAYGGD